MTLSSIDRTIDYTSLVGGELSLVYDFVIFSEAALDVYLNDTLLVLGSAYTVTGIGNPTGGLVQFTNALAALDRVQIFRNTLATQEIDFTPADPFPAETVETGFDKLTALVQDTLGELDRSLLLSPTSDLIGLEVPEPVLGAVLGVTTQEPAQLVWLENAGTVTPTGSIQETHTATAGQTVFVLASAYQPGVGQIHVYINGVRQHPTAFSESGPNTITFTGPLEAGDVVFTILAAFQNFAGADASAVSFTQAGAGAVTTTVQQKLFDLPTVLDYGAVGDGVADDTGAFLTAIASHGTVFVPTGTYLLAAAVMLPVNNSLIMSPLAILNATGGLSIAGEFLGADTVHFPVTAVVTFTSPDARILPEWFGAVPAATLADRTIALGRAFAALTAGGIFRFATNFQTLDAVPVTDEFELPFLAGDLGDVNARVVGKEGVATARAWYEKRAFTFADAVPTVTIQALIDEHVDVESNPLWGGVTFVTSLANLQLQVTGLAATTIDWRIDVQVRKHQV